MPQPVDRLALAFQSPALTIPAQGIVLVLRAVPSPFLDMVPAERLRCVQSFRPLHDALAAMGHRVAPRAEGPAAMVVVNLTRSRAESLGNIAAGLGLLPPGGRLVVTGAKSEGVDSIARQVARQIRLDGAFVKAHGRVFWLTRPEDPLPAEIAAWAEAAAPAPNGEGFVTAPGVFSHERSDPGSRRLAAALKGRLAGRVADLGAGWGWLARAALEAAPAIESIDLYEAEALALDAARLNVTDPRASFHWSDVTGLGNGIPPYDAVITNPPFHAGRAAEPDLGATFIVAAARILKPAGRLLMVANRQLPYEATVAASFRHWEKLAEDGIYKVIRAERPRHA
jgi:16S rRNA (guanine1207-N2)-methyltransferase